MPPRTRSLKTLVPHSEKGAALVLCSGKRAKARGGRSLPFSALDPILAVLLRPPFDPRGPFFLTR